MDDDEVRARVADVEARLADLEALEEPARSAALNAVRSLADVYGEGLARIVGRIVRAGANGSSDVIDAIADDELISHLLALHDLNPEAAEELQLGSGFVPRSALTKR